MFKVILLLLMLLFIAIYYVPSFVAIKRKHVHVLQITILNTFLGWSFIPWVAALIWATTNNIDENINTKSSWIMIGVVSLLCLMPIFIISLVPSKYMSEMIHETQTKKVIYTNNNGKIIKEVTEIKHIEDDD